MAVASVLKQIRMELKDLDKPKKKSGNLSKDEFKELVARGFIPSEIEKLGAASARAVIWNDIPRDEALGLKKARTIGARDKQKRKRRLGEAFSAPEQKDEDWEETSGGIRRKKEYMDKWRGESRESYLKKPPETEEEETPKHKETPKYIPKEHKEYKEEWEETESGGIRRKERGGK
jgi:hypothetical protein